MRCSRYNPPNSFTRDQSDEIDGQQRGEHPERETADQAVAEGRLVLAAGQAEHHDRHHQRVVGAQEAFQRHQGADGDEIPVWIPKTY